MKFQIYASLTAGFEEAAKNNQQTGSAELDELKRMLTETNPYLLILTAVVSVLHMVYVFNLLMFYMIIFTQFFLGSRCLHFLQTLGEILSIYQIKFC